VSREIVVFSLSLFQHVSIAMSNECMIWPLKPKWAFLWWGSRYTKCIIHSLIFWPAYFSKNKSMVLALL